MHFSVRRFAASRPAHASRMFAAAALLLVASPGYAEVHIAGASLSGSATAVSDYRFRGVSFSNLKPALQADLTLQTKDGLFASAWASNSAEYAGADVELNLSAGWTGGLGPATAAAGVITYLYPGAAGSAVYEMFSTLSMQLGPVSGTVGGNWAPGQSNLRSSSRYVFGAVEAGIPLTPFTLDARIGHERGGMVEDERGKTTSKLDWQAGVRATFTAVTVGVSYVGNNLPRTRAPDGHRTNRTARNAIVASVSVGF